MVEKKEWERKKKNIAWWTFDIGLEVELGAIGA